MYFAYSRSVDYAVQKKRNDNCLKYQRFGGNKQHIQPVDFFQKEERDGKQQYSLQTH
jgi:hypothetical protein